MLNNVFSFNRSPGNNDEISVIKSAIERGTFVDSMQDSTVYHSDNRELCRKYNYEHGAAIKEYKHKGEDYHKKVLLYQQATEFCSNTCQNEQPTITTPFGEKKVVVIPIDNVYYDERTQKTYTISAFVPGYNMAYREFEDDIPVAEQISHEAWRMFEFFTTRLEHFFDSALSRTGIQGISLSSANFMVPKQDVRRPSDEIYITDMSDNIAYMAQY